MTGDLDTTPQGIRPATRPNGPMVAPWVISCGVHTLILIAAVFIGRSVASPRPTPEPLAVSFFDPGPPPPPDVGAPSSDPLPAPEASPLDVAPRLALPSLAPIAPVRIPTVIDLAVPDPPELVLPATAIETPIDLGTPPDLPDAHVYGSGVSEARSIVYVIDGSASMISTLPMVLEEVKKSIDRLSPAQQFQLVFFRSGDYVAFEPTGEDPEVPRSTLYDATKANKRAAFDWLDAYRPAGTSNPLYAIEIALALPGVDAVFLLSTRITGVGSFEPDAAAFLASLDKLNPRDPRSGFRPVAIKVIQFFDRDPSGLLAQIGAEHGGDQGYSFVGREDITR